MSTRDSPDTVTVSCTECGQSVVTDEGTARAASRGLEVVTCDDCTHDCLNHFGEGSNEPGTPDHIVHYTCQLCGEFWEFNVRTAEHEVDR